MKYTLSILAALCLFACGEEDDRQENLLKLRGIGAVSNPLVSVPSVDPAAPLKVELTVYTALPIGETATVEAFEDEFSPYVANLSVSDIAVDTGSLIYQSYPGFQIMTFKATLNVPIAQRFKRTNGAGQAKYGFLIKSGSEVEKLVGTFLVYPEGSPELSYTNPEVNLVTPTEGLSLKSAIDVNMTAELTDKNDEDLKLGWFASGGKVKNRRAKSTSWETPGVGEHTVIFTARGRKSRGFAMQIVKVKVE
jgi:hypothetical protein